MDKKIYAELGTLLRDSRKHTNLSQKEVANVLGIHRITYTNLENGKITAPFHLIILAAETLGFSLDQLKSV